MKGDLHLVYSTSLDVDSRVAYCASFEYERVHVTLVTFVVTIFHCATNQHTIIKYTLTL